MTKAGTGELMHDFSHSGLHSWAGGNERGAPPSLESKITMTRNHHHHHHHPRVLQQSSYCVYILTAALHVAYT